MARDEGELRRVILAGRAVDYRLVRARRRTIGMQIGLDGLTVRASRWVTLRAIDACLAERADWILRALRDWQARRRPVLPNLWKTGEPILYRGRELALALHPARQPVIRADLFHLQVLHPAPDDTDAVAASVGRWLKDEALAAMAPRVASYTARLPDSLASTGNREPVLRLSNARNTWGSCNRRGEIRLNWRLVLLPADLADYVVAHEVAHLVELNHSPRFWAVVDDLFPGHRAARQALRDWTALLEV